ncbi:MAG: glycine zipper domain-containing protein [Caulobacteraceae bacterium]
MTDLSGQPTPNMNGTSDMANNQTPGEEATFGGAQPKKTRAAKAADKLDQTADKLGEAADEGIDRLRVSLERLENKLTDARVWGQAKSERARELIEEQPLMAVGAALGVGLLLGMLISR